MKFTIQAMEGDAPLPGQPFWTKEFDDLSSALDAARKTSQTFSREYPHHLVLVLDSEADELGEAPVALVYEGRAFISAEVTLGVGKTAKASPPPRARKIVYTVWVNDAPKELGYFPRGFSNLENAKKAAQEAIDKGASYARVECPNGGELDFRPGQAKPTGTVKKDPAKNRRPRPKKS